MNNSHRHVNEEVKQIIQGTDSYKLEKYFDELLEQNKQLHAENERYKNTLERIVHHGKQTFYTESEVWAQEALEQAAIYKGEE